MLWNAQSPTQRAEVGSNGILIVATDVIFVQALLDAGAEMLGGTIASVGVGKDASSLQT
jgi:hypothetical protein